VISPLAIHFFVQRGLLSHCALSHTRTLFRTFDVSVGSNDTVGEVFGPLEKERSGEVKLFLVKQIAFAYL